MNNEKQLKDLQKTIDEAQKQIQELMDQKDEFEFSGGRYYIRAYDCGVERSLSDEPRQAGNNFETREFAEYAAKMRLRQNIMLKAAERFNPEGWRMQWKGKNTAYVVFINHRDDVYEVNRAYGAERPETVVFMDEETAQKAIPFIKYHMEKLDK